MPNPFDSSASVPTPARRPRTLEELRSVFEAANEHRDYSIYTRAMDAATRAKARDLFPHFCVNEGDVIVDAGSGTGALAELAAREFSHARVYALEISHELHERAREARALARYVYGDAQAVHFPEGSVAVKYFCMVGHEIESFGGSMELAARTAHHELEPGGRLLIRDYVRPSRSGHVFMRILNTAGSDRADADYTELSTTALFRRFAAEFGGAVPYAMAQREGVRCIHLPLESAQEFYLRKDYAANWRQEIRERYTYWTAEQARRVLEGLGYVQVQVVLTLNEWIYEHRLKGQIALFEEAPDGTLKPLDFPPTHMVIVGEKSRDFAVRAEPPPLPEGVDYPKLLATVVLGADARSVRVGGQTFAVDPASRRQGRKKIAYVLADDPARVLKLVRPDTLNHHNAFKAMQQTIERRQILEQNYVPHARVLQWDPDGPPYRYLVQERLPVTAVSVADLILEAGLTEDDVRQMAEIVNRFEDGRLYQLDTNPHNWYRRLPRDGPTELRYADGKVYLYDERWAFRRVGLLQWLDARYVQNAREDCAAIPTASDFEKLQAGWAARSDPMALWWKRHLHARHQP